MHVPLLYWVLFNGFVFAVLVLDLAVFHRKPRELGGREALGWTLVWVLLAGCFAALILHLGGRRPALQFTTGYLIEQALSADNLFIFLLIFQYFKVPAERQHSVLFWGIIGALLSRGIFIVAGVTLINRFEWIIYLFGAFLAVTGARMFFQGGPKFDPKVNPALRVVRRFLRVTPDYEGGKFFVKREGALWATPLFIALVVIEVTDVVFATDSIPAVLAVTRDPFLVYTANVFAVLGLRSLYFGLAGLMKVFHHLHYGVSAILVFIGMEMLTSRWLTLPTEIILSIIAAILACAVLASVFFPPAKKVGPGSVAEANRS